MPEGSFGSNDCDLLAGKKDEEEGEEEGEEKGARVAAIARWTPAFFSALRRGVRPLAVPRRPASSMSAPDDEAVKPLVPSFDLDGVAAYIAEHEVLAQRVARRCNRIEY